MNYLRATVIISWLTVFVWTPKAATPTCGTIEPWRQWEEEPLTVALYMRATNVVAATGTNIMVTLADRSMGVAGLGCSYSTNTDVVPVALKPYQVYYCTVIGTNLSGMDIYFDVGQPWTSLDNSAWAQRDANSPLVTARTAGIANRQASVLAVPQDSIIVVDGAISDGAPKFNVSNPGGCNYYSNTFQVEIRKKPNPNFERDDDNDDADAAPGDGTWASIGPGRSLFTNNFSFDWSVSLGNQTNGNRAGRLRLRETDLITGKIYTTAALFYSAKSTNVRSQVQLISTNTLGTLRQVKGAQCFVDLVTAAPGTNIQYEARFYLPSAVGSQTNLAGLYTNITGNPYVVWTIQNPDTTVSNRICIIETRNGTKRTNEVAYNAASQTDTWTLKYGTASNQRVETRGVVFTTAGSTNRTETVKIQYSGAASPAYLATETYRLYPWGWELKQVVTDPSGAALQTTYEYYEDYNDPYTFRQLKTVVHPDGFWELREYSHGPEFSDAPAGTLEYVLGPWQDSPSTPASATHENAKVMQYRYESPTEIVALATSYGEPNGAPFVLVLDNVGVMNPHSTVATYNNYRIRPESEGRWIGRSERRYTERAQPGFADKPLEIETYTTVKDWCYYDFGTYNAGTRTFTDQQSGGDSFRASTLRGVGHEVFNVGGDAPAEWVLHTVDWDLGHLEQLAGYSDSVQLMPYQSTKESVVYKNGAPVLQETYVYTGKNGTNAALFSLSSQLVCTADTLGHITNILWLDPANASLTRIVYSADYRGTNALDGDLKFSEMDENGVQTIYTYDSLKRPSTTKRAGVAASGAYPAQDDITLATSFDAFGRKISEVTSAGALVLTNAWSYDLSGRLVSQTTNNVFATTYAYANDTGHTTTETLPGGATRITSRYRDRRVKSITGSAVVSQYLSYSNTLDKSIYGDVLNPDAVRSTKTIRFGSPSSERVTCIGSGWIDREIWVERPGVRVTNTVVDITYYRDGHMNDKVSAKRTEAYADDAFLNNGTLPYGDVFDYDASGRLSAHGTQQNFTNFAVLAKASLDRFTETQTWFWKDAGGSWFEVATNLTYLTDNNATPTVVGAQRRRLSGFSSGQIQSQAYVTDVDSNQTVVTVYVDRANKLITEVSDSPQSSLNATNITRNGLLQAQSTATVSDPITFQYDSLGRQTQQRSPLGAVIILVYDAQTSLLNSTTDFAGNTTTYEYYPSGSTNFGRLKCQTAPDGRKTMFDYTMRAEPWRSWGDIAYPVQRSYNEYGDLTELRSFRAGTGWNGVTWPASPGTADTTTWSYQASSGALLSKTDAQSRSVSYSYDLINRVEVRTWARGISVTNSYTPMTDLASVTYSDSTPSIVYTNFDRTGLPKDLFDGSGNHTFMYDHASRLISDKCTSGILAGLTVSNSFDSLYGHKFVKLLGASGDVQHDYNYDSFGRVASVVEGTYSVNYAYLPKSDRLEATTCKSNTTTVLTTKRTWFLGERFQSIANVANSATVSSHDYLCDSSHRRTQATLEDGSKWKYAFNSRNELISAKHYWSDWTPVAGQQFEYVFDNIGNRTATKAGGDASGSGLRSATYSANSLNQYSSRTVPGAVDVLGAATASASVTVNSTVAYERGEYYHLQSPVSNGSGPAYPSITVTATQGGSSTNQSGNLLVPPAMQTFSYDADGNLTNDSVWTYVWDAENRLRFMEGLNTVPTAGKLRLDFVYDYRGRRNQKIVATWSGSAFVPQSTNNYVYDDWHLIADLYPDQSLKRSYSWGPDLTGTTSGAGGVGGLVMLRLHGNGTTNSFYSYDGNGNVIGLTSSSGQSAANYSYSPFGELLCAAGPLARSNPFRFSTKFLDSETGLLCYGQRYYNPDTGKWLSRDPIEEADLLNLTQFLANSPLSTVDANGENRVDWWALLVALMAAYGDFEQSDPGKGNAGPENSQEIIQEIKDKILGDTKPPKGTKPGGSRPPVPKKIRPTTTTIVQGRNYGGKFFKRVLGPVAVVGAFSTIAQGAESSSAFTNELQDFGRAMRDDDDPYMLLSAVNATIEFQNIGGNYYASMYLLGTLLDIADPAD